MFVEESYTMKIASFLVLAALTASVLSAEPDKTCDEKGGTCLDIGTLPNTTKPSEKKALLDLYESVGKPKAMLHCKSLAFLCLDRLGAHDQLAAWYNMLSSHGLLRLVTQGEKRILATAKRVVRLMKALPTGRALPVVPVPTPLRTICVFAASFCTRKT